MDTYQGKEVVLMFHGWYNCSLNSLPYVKLLKDHMRCIAICSRGYGYSSYNTPMKSYKDLADDVILMIKEHFEFRGEPIYLLGHSFGCIKAIHIAAQLPDRIKGVIQISPQSVTG